MGRNSIQKFLDEFDVNSPMYYFMLLISAILIAAMLFVDYQIKQENGIKNLRGQSNEIIIQQ